MKTRKRFTYAEDLAMIKGFSEGLTTEGVAKNIYRNTNAIHSRMFTLKLAQIDVRQLARNGNKAEEILHNSVFYQGRPIKEAESVKKAAVNDKLTLITEAAKGFTLEGLGKVLGISGQAASKRLQTIGLTLHGIRRLTREGISPKVILENHSSYCEPAPKVAIGNPTKVTLEDIHELMNKLIDALANFNK